MNLGLLCSSRNMREHVKNQPDKNKKKVPAIVTERVLEKNACGLRYFFIAVLVSVYAGYSILLYTDWFESIGRNQNRIILLDSASFYLTPHLAETPIRFEHNLCRYLCVFPK